MDLIEYVAVLRKRWGVIVVIALLGALLGYGYAKSQEPTYRATSKVFVSVDTGDSVSDLVQGSTFTQNLVQSYAQLTTTPAVLEPVANDLYFETDSRQLAKQVTADTPLDTVIIEISATSGNADQAAAIANAVARQLPKSVDEVAPSSRKKSNPVSITTISRGAVPTVPISPNTKYLTASGGVAGLLLGLAFVILWRLLDTKIRDRRDVENISDTPVLGEVPRSSGSRAKQVALTSEPRGRRAEAYRTVRSNFEFVTPQDVACSVVVTSAQRTKGKSATAVNFALAMAEQHQRVIIVDADLRDPVIAEMAGIDGTVGLTSILKGRASIDEATQPWGETTLDVISSGAVPPNPLQLLDSDAMFRLVAELRKRYDVVVLDTPPLLPFADAAILAKHADGAVLTVTSGRTRRSELASAIEMLGVAKTAVLGIILVRVRSSRRQS
jgi:capsular exopolysaccharide synthesis family protein